MREQSACMIEMKMADHDISDLSQIHSGRCQLFGRAIADINQDMALSPANNTFDGCARYALGIGPPRSFQG